MQSSTGFDGNPHSPYNPRTLWGADYNAPVGSASNDSVRVALTNAALIVTLRRYLDTAASRTVQALVSERVVLGVDLGIATIEGESEKFIGPDGREWTRQTVSRGAACEPDTNAGRSRYLSEPPLSVSLRVLPKEVLKRKPRLTFRKRTPQPLYGPSKVPLADHKLKVSPRPCSNCGRKLQPTVQRRLLCAYCFRGGDEGSVNGGWPEHGIGD